LGCARSINREWQGRKRARACGKFLRGVDGVDGVDSVDIVDIVDIVVDCGSSTLSFHEIVYRCHE
jgi:hypothetical protein